MDLAMNQNYQVVVEWDPAFSWSATLWVDPVSTADASGIQSSDIISSQPAPAQAFAIRQPSSFGNWFCTISNLVTATTFDDAATTVWPYGSVNPSIAIPLQAVTNFVQGPPQLSIVAAGQGMSNQLPVAEEWSGLRQSQRQLECPSVFIAGLDRHRKLRRHRQQRCQRRNRDQPRRVDVGDQRPAGHCRPARRTSWSMLEKTSRSRLWSTARRR